MRHVVLLCVLLFAGAAAPAPADLAWQQHPGAAVPPDIVLRDESGAPIRLDQVFGQVPVILDLGYFHCPSLCGVVRADLLNALQASGLTPGGDYTLVSLSIDPAETPHDAAQAKAADLAVSERPDGSAWHYLTGPSDAIAEAVGFRSRWDADFKQFLHPTGIVVLTRNGRVSAYLTGVGYSGADLRAAVLRAGTGGIAPAALPILLLCFHFDASTGKYTLAVEKILRLMAGVTVLALGGWLVALSRKGRKHFFFEKKKCFLPFFLKTPPCPHP